MFRKVSTLSTTFSSRLNAIKSSPYLRLDILVILFVAFFWTYHIFEYERWNNENPKQQTISNDAVSYYAYLPAVIIHQDLTLSFYDIEKSDYEYHRYHPVYLDNGNKLIKMSMGLSILYLPFFLVGHAWALMFGFKPTGFTDPYEIAISISTVFYAVLGLIFLGRILRRHFSNFITGLTLLVIGIGTNLFTYVAFKCPMVHGYNFFMITAFLYGTTRFLSHPRLYLAITLGFLGGLIILTRPTNLIPVLFIPLLYNVYSRETLKDRLRFFKKYAPYLAIAIACCALVGIPQLIYWKTFTGNWLFFSYKGESFYWDRFMIPQVLFSYRNGWLIYTPVMFFAIAGFFLLKKDLKKYLWLNVLTTVVLLYVFSCWWTWWFGGGHGYRPMIDLYGILAIPMAASFRKIFANGWFFKFLLIGILGFFIHLNLFQQSQYSKALLHWDAMTEEAYWSIFLQRKWPKNYGEKLDHPNYEKAVEGAIDIPGEPVEVPEKKKE